MELPMKITVLGAGVVGLTTAMLLSRDDRFSVTIVAKHMPGDYDTEYASPFAGANYLPVGRNGTLLAKLERETWPELARLAKDVPEAAVHFQDTVLYRREKDSKIEAGTVSEWKKHLIENDPWYKDIVPKGNQFRLLKQDELPSGHESGFAFTSVCINTSIYLPWLAGQCLKNGVIIKRGEVMHIKEAADLHHSGQQADIVINCTGLGAKKLAGVMDTELYPGRGQWVLVRNDPKLMVTTSGTDEKDELTYIMHRAAGGGCILGGCLQADSWDTQPDPTMALRIMKRSVAVCPELTGGKGIEALSIIRHSVGLRPMRKGGPRIESQNLDGLWVVHSYGHGGYGYQSSYGSAKMAVDLVEGIVRGQGQAKVAERARL